MGSVKSHSEARGVMVELEYRPLTSIQLADPILQVRHRICFLNYFGVNEVLAAKDLTPVMWATNTITEMRMVEFTSSMFASSRKPVRSVSGRSSSTS